MLKAKPYEDPHPRLTTTTERRLLAIVKLAYLKTVDPDSDAIGFEELGSRLCDEICNATDPDHFCEWLDGVRGGE